MYASIPFAQLAYVKPLSSTSPTRQRNSSLLKKKTGKGIQKDNSQTNNDSNGKIKVLIPELTSLRSVAKRSALTAIEEVMLRASTPPKMMAVPVTSVRSGFGIIFYSVEVFTAGCSHL